MDQRPRTNEQGAAVPPRSEAYTQLEVALSLARIQQQLAREATIRAVPSSMELSHRGHIDESSYRGQRMTSNYDLGSVTNLSGTYRLPPNGPLGQANIPDPLHASSLPYYDPFQSPYSQIQLPLSDQIQLPLPGYHMQLQPYRTGANPVDPIHLAMMSGSMIGNPLIYPPIQSFSAQLPPGSRVLSVAMIPTVSDPTTQTQVTSLPRWDQPAVPLDRSRVTGTTGLDVPVTTCTASQLSYAAPPPKNSAVVESSVASLMSRTVEALKQSPHDEESLDEDSEPSRRNRRKYNHESFPEKLHRMITEAAICQRDHIVRFTDDGTQFQILHTKPFEDQILPQYFRHNRISSFKRLLRMYGFRRVDGTWMQGTFEHPLFKRDRPRLCKRIERTSSGKGRKHEKGGKEE